MAAAAVNQTYPLTLDLSGELLARVTDACSSRGICDLSALVRQAVAQFNFQAYQVKAPVHRQISVRLTAATRQNLQKISRKKKASVSELVRAALASLANQPHTNQNSPTNNDMPQKKATKSKVAKKSASCGCGCAKETAKKAPAKKAAKKK